MMSMPLATGGLGWQTSSAVLTSLTLTAGGDAVITFRAGGIIEIAPGYSTDAAAKAFWDAVEKIAPEWVKHINR